MRLLTWNIRAGGGKRLPPILAAISGHEADVLVLTEYRSGEAGVRLRAALTDLGYAWLSPMEPPGTRNTGSRIRRDRESMADARCSVVFDRPGQDRGSARGEPLGARPPKAGSSWPDPPYAAEA